MTHLPDREAIEEALWLDDHEGAPWADATPGERAVYRGDAEQILRVLAALSAPAADEGLIAIGVVETVADEPFLHQLHDERGVRRDEAHVGFLVRDAIGELPPQRWQLLAIPLPDDAQGGREA